MNDTNKKLININLGDILPNRFQPRIKFNEDLIYELSQSIKEHGVLQPIIVRPISDKYEIVTGERRYKAAVLAGLETIPAIVYDIEDKDSVELALIENIQRKDLSAIEEAISYKKILDMGYLTQEKLAEKLGKSQSTIANKIRLLSLSDEVQEALMEEEISERHARSLLKVNDESIQHDLLYRVISEKMTVRKLDQEITKLLEQKNSSKAEAEKEISKGIEEEPKEKELEQKDKETTTENKEEIKEEKTDLNLIFEDLLNNENSDFNISIEDVDDNENEENVEKSNEQVLRELETDEVDNDMNNMLNLDEQINYNTLKGTTTQGNGKFFNSAVLEEEEKTTEEPKQNEPQSIFNFATGKIDNNTDNRVTVQRDLGNNSSTDLLSNKINDLLSPIGSSPTFETESSYNQDHIFASSNESNEQSSSIFGINTTSDADKENSNNADSIFANLMKTNSEQTSNLSNNDLQSFLDPTFVNGQKQEQSLFEENKMSASVFDKFIDEDFGGEITTESSGSLLSSSILNEQSLNESKESNSESTISNLLTPTDSSVNLEPKIETKTEIEESPIELNNQAGLIAGLMASSNKPDLLAPMSDSSLSSSNQSSKNIFDESTNTNQTATNIFGGLSSNTLEKTEFENSSSVIEEQKTESFSMDVFNKSLETDNNNTAKSLDEFTSISESISKPVFITASSNETNVSAPSTPIITDVNMSNLLAPSNTTEEEIKELEPKEETVVNEQQSETVEESNEVVEETSIPTTNNNIDIQPIIITDYNKQYDPILPPSSVPKSPIVDFKNVLALVREVSDKIENLGYKIDTEEIDLEGIYQVIFNIEKK